MIDVDCIYTLDCVEGMKQIEEDFVDAIITDPPYGLGFMGKKWDMLPPSKEVFEECLRVLKPGGYLLSFGGTRTYHRMAVAIEDAGFDIRDMIEWVYGSGFPKSHNIGKAVDKLQGKERKVVGYTEWKRGEIKNVYHKYNVGHDPITAPATKESRQWEGWGTALKPAHEPICMARKPLAEKSVAKNCLKWGTGGINIDESRVGKEVMGGGTMPDFRDVGAMSKEAIGIDKLSEAIGIDKLSCGQNPRPAKRKEHPTYTGRFPANLIHDGSEEVLECFPETYSRHGNTSRYFKSIKYCPKASKKERGNFNNHLTVKPIKLMEYLIKMVTREEAIVLDPFLGSGTTAMACKKLNRRFIGFELNAEYAEIARKRVKSIPIRLVNFMKEEGKK